jgi:hypothetical protein
VLSLLQLANKPDARTAIESMRFKQTGFSYKGNAAEQCSAAPAYSTPDAITL